MKKKHKQVLQVNIKYLTENIVDPEVVTGLLYEKEVFTEDMRQQVGVRKTIENIFFSIVE